MVVGERLPTGGGGAGLRRPGDPAVAGGRRRGSRRAGPAPGRCRPARRCVTTPVMQVGVVIAPPGVRVAMVNAAARSRCPANRQWWQVITLPRGLLILCLQAGQVDEVPRSSTRYTRIPARAALSCTMRRVWPICHCRSRRLCRRPARWSRVPRGSPTVSVPIRCSTAQSITVVVASCRACRTRRWCRPSTCRARRRVLHQRRDPRCPRAGVRPAVARRRRFVSARCRRCSARIARPETSRVSPLSAAATANGWMMPRSTPATRPGSGSSPAG